MIQEDREEYIEEMQVAEQTLETGNTAEAKKILKGIIKKNPVHFKAYLLLGQVYIVEENFSKALEVYEKIKEEYPLVPDGYYYLGSIHNMIGNYGQAIEDFNLALGLEQKLLEATIGKAIALCELGGSVEALDILDKAMDAAEIAEDSILLYEAKAMIHLEYRGEREKAKEIANRILKLDPKNVVAQQIQNALQ